jgi:hypothetical protein
MRVLLPAIFRAVPLLAALLLVPTAVAAPTIALHPLIIVGGEGAETSPYSALLAPALERHGVHPSHPERVRDFLAKHDGPCQDLACLGALAKAAQADRVLVVSVAPYTPRAIVSARLISASGVEITSVAGREYPKGGHPLNVVLKQALDDFLSTFPFDAPEPKAPEPVHTVAQPTLTPPVTPVTVAPPIRPPAATVPTPPPSSHPILRTASYLTAGLGVVALAGAATVALASRTDRAKLDQMSDAEGNLRPTSDAFALHDKLASRSRLTNVLLIGGGAAVAAGAAMFFLSRPSNAPTVALSVGPDGGGAFVSGRF